MKMINIYVVIIQKNAPYPVVVPGFPLIPTDSQLDYGQKMNR